MNARHHDCGGLLEGFTFRDIREAAPPKEKGVYVLRIRRRGTPTREMLQQTSQVLERLRWRVVADKIESKVSRLDRVGNCPVIYIGSGGTRSGGNNTLRGRYEEFADRHTAMYPIWVLLYFGWELDYGWKTTLRPADLEDELKQQYRQQHNGSLPALTSR